MTKEVQGAFALRLPKHSVIPLFAEAKTLQTVVPEGSRQE